MPQTREHLILAKQIGISNIVVYINKVDAADQEMVELAEIELRELMNSMGMEGDKIPFVSGSALCALEGTKPEIGRDSIMKLMEAVDSYIPDPVRALDKPYLLPIDSVYSIPGRGTVVTGRLDRGVIKKGMECELIGYSKKFKSTITDIKAKCLNLGIEMFHKTLEEGQAGDQMGALIRGIKRDELRRGMAVCKPGSIDAHDQVEVQVYVLTKDEGGNGKPFTTNHALMMFSKTWDVSASVLIVDKDMVMPGEDSRFMLKLIKTMFMEQGQRFTLRSGSTTVGTGVVTKILPNMSPQERERLMMGAKKRAKLEAKKQDEQNKAQQK
uniref:Elongation factor Tu, mitochondrial n=1 Tax=Strigamia maritima TaxID=126957 RepID=T1J6F1_STRMM